MKIKSILLDIDNVLYDSAKLTEAARRNAIISMIEAGLPVKDVEQAHQILLEIVKGYGSNYPYHFDRLLEKFGVKWNPHIIAAGVVAYDDTKHAYLKPYPEVIPTLLKLKAMGYKLGIISDGRAVKQWDKLIRLGVQHFFDVVITSEEVGVEKPDSRIFEAALEALNCRSEECLMIGDRLTKDIAGANKAGVISVRVLKGRYANEKPVNPSMKPKFEIKNLTEIFDVLAKLS